MFTTLPRTLFSAVLALTATLVIVAGSAAPVQAAPIAHTVAVPR